MTSESTPDYGAPSLPVYGTQPLADLRPADEPQGVFCACSDPECPTLDDQYTHG